jgi:CheY-like chemotaxis protein/two-component sensor histidine kinase
LIDENMAIEEILDCIRTIQASGTHLLNLINDMFHLSALEADQLTLSNETVSISRVFNDIKDLVLSYQQVENKQHLEIRYIPDPSMYDLKIVTDYQKLVEILINLIKNSIKFTEKGYVKYGWVAYEDKVTFFVKDTGIGIPEEKRDIIFQKFRQGDESSTRKYGGAGIGLTLVKALTEIMEGRVYFESDPGAGTTFFVELPCLPEDTANKPVCKKYEALTTAEIIVVEDEETNYYLIESILRKYKTRLIHFKDGETALKYIEEGGQPNIILMDIRLPGIDGLEITRRIKALKPNIPIIAQTAYAMSGDRERALSAGCDDYISKPFKRQQLLDLIIQYLH